MNQKYIESLVIILLDVSSQKEQTNTLSFKEHCFLNNSHSVDK